MAQQTMLEKLSTEISGIIESAAKSVVLVQGRRFPSSGIVWQKNLVVTADHTLTRSEEVQLRIASGEVISASVAGRDPALDLAFLKTSAELQPLQHDTNETLHTGNFGITLGRASGGRVLGVLSMISGIDSTYRNWRGGTFDQFIRLDIAPFPGFSGSAFLLPNGRVAGMNTSVFSRHFGLTVPASNIERIAQRILTKGTIGKPYLGIMAQPVRIPEAMRQLTQAEIGLLLMGTEKGSPAEESGLLIGDIVVQLNEKNINSTEEILALLTEESIGKEAKATIIRGGNLQELQIKVGERPARL